MKNYRAYRRVNYLSFCKLIEVRVIYVVLITLFLGFFVRIAWVILFELTNEIVNYIGKTEDMARAD